MVLMGVGIRIRSMDVLFPTGHHSYIMSRSEVKSSSFRPSSIAFWSALFLLTTLSNIPAAAQTAPGAKLLTAFFDFDQNDPATFVIVDLGTNTVTKTIPLAFADANSISLSPDKTLAYVSHREQDIISVIDLESETLIGTIFIVTWPGEIYHTPDGSRAFVTSGESNRVRIVDLNTGTIIKSLVVANNPWRIQPSPDGKTLYVSGTLKMFIGVIDVATEEVVSTIEYGGDGWTPALAVSPDGNVMYFSGFPYSSWQSQFWAYDLDPTSSTFETVIQTLNMPAGTFGWFWDIKFAPDGTYAYAVIQTPPQGGDLDMGELVVIDTATHTYGNIDLVGRRSYRVEFLPDGSLAYVTNHREKSISIIDTSTYTVTETIHFQGEPGPMKLLAEDVATDIKTESSLPEGYTLHQNYPNPFNPSTTITFEIPEANHVTVTIVDALGRVVRTLMDQHASAGKRALHFEADGLAGGTYFVRLAVPEGQQTIKTILLK